MNKWSVNKLTIGPLLTGLLCIVILVTSYLTTLHIFRGVELDRAKAKLALYENTIDNELTRLSHLPVVLADQELVRNTALVNHSELLNQKLKSISDSARAEAIYLMNKDGLTIASSNFDAKQTFLGQNYGFRPYFKQSMSGKNSTFFAIGATTSRPGYFLSSPVRNVNNETTAVLALKLDLTRLNNTLEATDDLVLVTNTDNIILLSSKAAWRYKTLSPISKERLIEIKKERQFGRETLAQIDWQTNSDDEAVLGGTTYVKASKKLQNTDWTLTYLRPTNVVHERAILITAATLLIMGTIIMVVSFLRAQRLRQTLLASQRSRSRLQSEITVRRKAEQKLRKAQDELKRTSKMVALGQLAASVTHELGQPISAMKNHIAAEEINKSAPMSFLTNLTAILQRMEHITRQLRFFSTGSDDVQERVAFNRVITGALNFMSYAIEKDGIIIKRSGLDHNIPVIGSHQRLEQVIINLLRNAMKAMIDKKKKHITLKLTKENNHAILTVSDTGHGLLGQSLETLTEPFHTTGKSGEGMGLGLAISASIIAEHNGRITAGDNKGAGAWFTIELPLAPKSSKRK